MGVLGLCVCEAVDEYAVGIGPDATCIPAENMNFITPALRGFVYFLIALTLWVAVMCLGWIYRYRNNMLVKVAQPNCLGLIILGCIVSTTSIIPMGIETEYRDSPDINGADAACMAVPWLWGLGFTICFSSLFAKVWKVKQLYKASAQCRRVEVNNKSIMVIMGSMLFVECAILIAFQVVSPQIWEREVLQDVDGYAIESEGGCTSDYGWWFWLALFLFQIMVLAVPVTFMVMDDPAVFYFVRAFAVFLQNFSVLCIIFGPKMYRIHTGEDTNASVRRSICKSQVIREPNSRFVSTSEFQGSVGRFSVDLNKESSTELAGSSKISVRRLEKARKESQKAAAKFLEAKQKSASG